MGESVDYVSFVLDRVGVASQDGGGGPAAYLVDVGPVLLLALSKALRAHRFTPERVASTLRWCEAIVESLSSIVNGSSEDLKFDNVINLVQGNLEAAVTSTSDPAAFMAVIAKLR